MHLLEYLFMPPGPTGAFFARWGGVLAGAYAGLALGLGLTGWAMRVLNGRHRLNQWVTRRILVSGLALQALGLILLWLRILSLPILSMRLFLYLQLLAEVGAAGYLWWWLRNRYPGRLAVYQWEEKKRAYLPRAAGGLVESRRRTAAKRRR